MQPPPPKGCAGRASPGAGGAGATTDDEALAAGAAPNEKPTATINAVTQPHSAVRVTALKVPTGHNSSCRPVDTDVTRPDW